MSVAPLLVVAANPHASRLFLRRRKTSRLEELVEHADCADFLELHGRRFNTLHTHKGRTMVKSHALCADEEMELFLRRVAPEVDAALKEHSSADLALIAPPHALGMLRDFISSSSRSRLSREVTADMVQASPDDIAAAVA